MNSGVTMVGSVHTTRKKKMLRLEMTGLPAIGRVTRYLVFRRTQYFVRSRFSPSASNSWTPWGYADGVTVPPGFSKPIIRLRRNGGLKWLVLFYGNGGAGRTTAALPVAIEALEARRLVVMFVRDTSPFPETAMFAGIQEDGRNVVAFIQR